MEDNIVFIWRGIERLLIVGVGGLSIFLGYSLFLKIPQKDDGSGEFKFPGGISVVLSRVGPGIFFALFGSSVIGMAIYAQATAPAARFTMGSSSSDQEKVTYPPPSDNWKVSYSTGLETAADVQSLRSDRTIAIGDIRFLIDIQKSLSTAENKGKVVVTQHTINIADSAISRVKRLVMQSVWDDQWGDYGAFTRWVKGGAQQPIPEKARQAAGLFTTGEMILPNEKLNHRK